LSEASILSQEFDISLLGSGILQNEFNIDGILTQSGLNNEFKAKVESLSANLKDDIA
jgi:hypothetical protein